jgi:hypothetical protein
MSVPTASPERGADAGDGSAAALWQALGDASAAQTAAIAAGDADALDALLARKDDLLLLLAGRDLAADVAADPTLVGRVRAARAAHDAAEASLLAARDRLGDDLHRMRHLRTARRAFATGGARPAPEQGPPRIIDWQG